MSIQTDDFAPAPQKRVMSASPASPQEEAIERGLRPKLVDEYVGQTKARQQPRAARLPHGKSPVLYGELLHRFGSTQGTQQRRLQPLHCVKLSKSAIASGRRAYRKSWHSHRSTRSATTAST